MEYIKSCGFVVFKKIEGEMHYLIIRACIFLENGLEMTLNAKKKKFQKRSFCHLKKQWNCLRLRKRKVF